MEVISVLEVVDSIASQVPVPEEWQQGFLKHDEVPIKPYITRAGRVIISDSMHTLRVGFLNGAFRSAFRYSQAAGALDCYLDRSDSPTPSWFDCGQTGWHKVSIAARGEGLAMLVHMSRYFDRYRDAYLSGRLDSWPQINEMKSSEGKFEKAGDEQRLNELGFQRPELIEFLNENGIPHGLGETPFLSNREPLTNFDSIALQLTVDSTMFIETSIAENLSPTRSEFTISEEKKMQSCTTSHVHRIEGGDALTSIVEKAIVRAGNESTADVWVQLRDIAKEKVSPFTGIVKGPALQYKDDYDNDAYLTKDALRSRLKRRNKGR